MAYIIYYCIQSTKKEDFLQQTNWKVCDFWVKLLNKKGWAVGQDALSSQPDGVIVTQNFSGQVRKIAFRWTKPNYQLCKAKALPDLSCGWLGCPEDYEIIY